MFKLNARMPIVAYGRHLTVSQLRSQAVKYYSSKRTYNPFSVTELQKNSREMERKRNREKNAAVLRANEEYNRVRSPYYKMLQKKGHVFKEPSLKLMPMPKNVLQKIANAKRTLADKEESKPKFNLAISAQISKLLKQNVANKEHDGNIKHNTSKKTSRGSRHTGKPVAQDNCPQTLEGSIVEGPSKVD